MKSWVISVSIIAIVTSLSEFLLPNGKTQKTVRAVFGFCCLLVMSFPIVKIANGSISLFDTDTAEYAYQHDYLDYITESVQKQQTLYAEDCLADACIRFISVSLTVSATDYSVVGISVFGVTVEERERAKSVLQEKMNVMEEVIRFEN